MKRKILSLVMMGVLTLSVVSSTQVQAADKKAPTLSTSSKKVKVKKSFTLKLKKNQAKKIVKTTWKVSNKKVALSKKKKMSVRVTGKTAGTSKITATVIYKSASVRKKKKLTCKVVVKKVEKATSTQAAVSTPTPVPEATAAVNPTATPSAVPSQNSQVTKEGQKISTTGIKNARELGGYKTTDGWTIKRGLLLRTGSLSEATGADKKILAEDYNVGYDIDFRSEEEQKDAEDPNLGNMERTSVPVELSKYFYLNDTQEEDDNCYAKMLKDKEVLSAFSKFFRIVVDNRGNQAILWHGVKGEDRTGLAAAMLLSVLNVDQDTILEDYELSGAFNGNKMNRIKLEKAICYMEQQSGSVTNFVQAKMNLTWNEISSIRMFYREREASSLVDAAEWIDKLDGVSADTEQIVVVRGVGGTNADVGFYERGGDHKWREIFTTYGYIGRSGFQTDKREGDGGTPKGLYRFTHAFGIKEDPGCVGLPYKQVTDDDYWCGISGSEYYNQPIKKSEIPSVKVDGEDVVVDGDNSEHIIDYDPGYAYALNISWNESGEKDKGSAIFLHCFHSRMWTGGCVAIPENLVKYLLQRMDKDCAVYLDA